MRKRHLARRTFLATGLLATFQSLAAAQDRVSIDFATTLRPMEHRATGFLHSFSTTLPGDDMITPLKPYMFRARPDGANNQGAFPTHARVTAMGARMQVVISDGFNGDYAGPYPGDNGDWLPWENYVRGLVLRTKLENKPMEYDVWNEPDIGYFWRRDQATFLEAWRRAHQQIRLLDPTGTIIGPSLANENNTFLSVRDFLIYARNNNVLPDILSWHEFTGAFDTDVQDVRAFMAAENINISRIGLNEIISSGEMTRPGVLPRYFANVERENIDHAVHACWTEPSGISNCEIETLNGLLTQDTRAPRSTWWTYERYARMSGVSVDSARGFSVDGLGTKDDGIAHVLLGRFKTGSDNDVLLSNLDDVSNLLQDGTVRIVGERIANSGFSASAGPTQQFDRIYNVTGDGLIVTLPGLGNPDGYFLTLTAPPPAPAWANDADGTWSSPGNWSAAVPGNAGDRAKFGPVIGQHRMVTNDAARALGTLVFDSPHGYTIAGVAQIAMQTTVGEAAVRVNAGSQIITAPLRLNTPTTFNIIPAGGLLTVGGDLSAAVGVKLTKTGAGTLETRNVRADGLDVKAGRVVVTENGTPAGVSRMKSLAVAAGALLDLNDNDLIVDFTSAASTLETSIRALVKSGRIVSGTSTGDTVLAIADNREWRATTFNGESIDDTTIVGKYTYFGDANLDGKVTSDDYVAVDVGLGIGDSWVQGDFNMDGFVTSDDYVAIDTNLGKGTPTPLAWAELKAEMIALHTEMFGAEYVDKLAQAEANGFASLVPEPAPLLPAIPAAATLLARRRRNLRIN